MATIYLKDWEELANAKDLQTALIKHFSYLADNVGFDKVLAAVMKKAVSISYANEKLTIIFPGNEVLIAYPPTTTIASNYPESYKRVLLKHNIMYLQNAQITLGEHGDFNEDDGWFDALEEEESVLLEYGNLINIISPMWDYSDCWLYHPQEKNAFNEPVIYYLSHEGGDIYNAQPYNIGSLFLKRFAKSLGLEIEIPALSINNTIDYETWYNALDDNWKKLLNDKHDIKNESDAKKVTGIKNLDIQLEDTITSLEPIKVMEGLTDLYFNTDINDLTPITSLKKLTSLSISCKNKLDFSPIKQLTKLKRLNLSNTTIKDLEPIVGLVSLEKLDLKATDVEDITTLKNLKKLENLVLSDTVVKDLSPLKDLKKLDRLKIENTNLSSFEFLSSLNSLAALYASNSNISTLKYLLNCKYLSTLMINNTTISFEEILNVKSSLKHLNYGIYCGYTKSDQTFVETIENITFNTTGLEDTLIKWIDEYLISISRQMHVTDVSNKESHKQLLKRLINASIKLPLHKASIPVLEEILVNILTSIINGDVDKDVEEIIFKTFLPNPINNPSLLFNLACYYAKNSNKEKLIAYAQLALEKGEESSRFKTDKIFKAFLNDKDFKTLIDNPPLPDPERNPMSWWQNLPADLKKTLQYEVDEETEAEIKKLIYRKDFELYYDGAKSLTAIANWKNLYSLRLIGCAAQTLDVLATLTGLEIFECEKTDFPYGAVQYSDLSPLSKLENLKKLELSNHNITDISPLQNVVKLESLNLFGNKITSATPLTKLVKLQDLSISFDGDVKLDTSCFEHLKKLKYLNRACS